MRTPLLVILFFTLSVCNAEIRPLVMPVEVFGEAGTIVERQVSFNRRQVNAADQIFFFANNLGYQDKGSIQVNDGDWIDLNHKDVSIYEKEMHYGGMRHGAMNSIRFTIPAQDLTAGDNTFRFRFNFSNGISSGYRIFRMNLLREDGSEILRKDFIPEVDPSSWRAPRGYSNQRHVREGRRLWYNAELWNHPLPDEEVATWYGNELLSSQPIKATCSDCHTQDGRDLAYFNYSNHSIVERAKFHKLTADQGKKIAAYIRSLDVPTPGRPWNPPYQPGPEIADRPIEEWAAGAGIDAVLETDADMLPFMFPDGTSQANIDRYFDSDKMHDTTTVPISIQFPDWKHWLPIIHPKDAFGDFYAVENPDGSFSPGHAHYKHNPFVNYPPLRRFLKDNDHDEIVENREEFYSLLGNFWSSFRKFFAKQIGDGHGGGWRYSDAVADDYMPIQQPGFGQLSRTSLARLMAVKFFEIHQEFQLEEMTQRLIPSEDQPAPRQWLHAMGYNVFEVPPHFTAPAWGSTASYEGQPWLTGVFETTSWYELQLIINPGNGRAGGTGPVDYNYHPGFIRKVSSQGRPHPMRYYRAMNNVFQVKSFSGDLTDYRNKKVGFRLNQQGPSNIMPWSAPGHSAYDFTLQLEKVKPGANLPVKIINAMLKQLAIELEQPQNHPDTYGRSENGNLFKLELESKTEYDPKGSGYGDEFYRWFTRIQGQDIKLNPRRINRVIDWCETAWPNMDWEAIRP